MNNKKEINTLPYQENLSIAIEKKPLKTWQNAQRYKKFNKKSLSNSIFSMSYTRSFHNPRVKKQVQY